MSVLATLLPCGEILGFTRALVEHARARCIGPDSEVNVVVEREVIKPTAPCSPDVRLFSFSQVDDIPCKVKAGAFALVASGRATTPRRRIGVRMATSRPAVRRGPDCGIATALHQDLGASRRRDIAHIHIVINVVQECVVRSVVLVVARTFRMCSNVIGKDLVAAPFVRIVAPSPVIITLNVAAKVIFYPAARLMPECVDTP